MRKQKKSKDSGRGKSKKSQSRGKEKVDLSLKKIKNEQINMSALPSITRNLGYQL